MITDSIHTYYNILANKGLIFQFAFDYTDRNRARLNEFIDFNSFDKEFKRDNSIYFELVAYAYEKELNKAIMMLKFLKKKSKHIQSFCR